MKALYLATIILILFACTTETHEVVPPFEQRDIAVAEKMKIAVSEDYLHQIGLPDSMYTFVHAYYSQRDFQPRWINDTTITKLGTQMKSVLDAKYAIGIPEKRTITTKTSNYIQDEINITVALAQMIYDLQHGLIDYEKKVALPKRFVDPSKFDKLAKFSVTGDIRLQFLQFGPSDTTYQVLGKGLVELVDRLPLDTSTYDIVSIKYDTIVNFEKTRKALISKGYIDASVTDSTAISEGLTRFQIDNGLKPDGVIGKFTSKALNESTYHKMERIILAMDKIRTRAERPEKFIYINIPEYKLRFYADDSLKSEHNIVVGKEENQTPELTSKLQRIVLFPYWNVPYSISSKEILPSLKSNSNYLAKHNYKLFKNGVEVDPKTVNWKSIRQNAFPYKVRQEPGVRNSLGIIKFDFYNEHSVYFHDTPSKALFGADVRAYSHGCMRTQNPVDLGKIILHYDSVSPYKYNAMRPDSLDSLLSLDTSAVFDYRIKLMEPIPIFIEYQSVARHEEQMVVYIDIYGRDEEYLKILRE